tara:strand:- start:41 stop:373 length:333 start_codon:yes stop_codon:yes gene_type:complete
MRKAAGYGFEHIGENSFFADGYIVVRNLISQDELQTLRRHYEDLVLGRVANFPQEYISVHDVEGRADFGLARTESELEAPTNAAVPRFILRAKKPLSHSASIRLQTRSMP